MRTRDIREGRIYVTKMGHRFQVISIFPGEDRGNAEVTYKILASKKGYRVGATLRVDLEEFAERVDRLETERKKGGLS